MKTKNILIAALLLLIADCEHPVVSSAQVIAKNKNVKSSTIATGKELQTNWTATPYDRRIFIENKGQFDAETKSADKILYGVMCGGVNIYFTAHGVIYRFDKYIESQKEEEDEEQEPDKVSLKTTTQYINSKWEGSNPTVTVEGEDEQTYYYTYPLGDNRTIKANVFKKILYRNLYPGIDAEYIFPKDKEGIKYTLTVHPGADISRIKLIYAGAEGAEIDTNGDVVIRGEIGELIDHAPVSYYKEGEENIKTAYTLTGMEESFSVIEYDSTKTLVIDPWTIPTGFSPGFDAAYDVDYDYKGNVYAYGGGSFNNYPWQLAKFNSAGIQQWVFNATRLDSLYYAQIHKSFYGDFAVDKTTGTSYLVEGCNDQLSSGGTGSWACKVNTQGLLVGTFKGDTNMYEMWRAKYDECNHHIVIGGGTGATNHLPQTCILDTNMQSLTIVNSLNATEPNHDINMLVLDPSGGYLLYVNAFAFFRRHCGSK